MLRYTTDRARPGLVALYDIRPGNGAGPFLQPEARTGHIRLQRRTCHVGVFCSKAFGLLEFL